MRGLIPLHLINTPAPLQIKRSLFGHSCSYFCFLLTVINGDAIVVLGNLSWIVGCIQIGLCFYVLFWFSDCVQAMVSPAGEHILSDCIVVFLLLLRLNGPLLTLLLTWWFMYRLNNFIILEPPWPRKNTQLTHIHTLSHSLSLPERWLLPLRKASLVS